MIIHILQYYAIHFFKIIHKKTVLKVLITFKAVYPAATGSKNPLMVGSLYSLKCTIQKVESKYFFYYNDDAKEAERYVQNDS